MRAAVYVRISSDPAGQRAGVERQRRDCLEECERRGWEPEVYEDNDVSAYRGKPRPAYDQMLADVAAKKVGAILAWAPDRITRHLKELETLVALVEGTGCRVTTIQGGEWDLTTPEGRFMARQLGLLARLESEKIASRVSKARADEARSGRAMVGGRRPWGFEADFKTHHPVEAEEVRDAARRLLAGEALISISRRTGRRPTSIRNALLSPRMIGRRTYKGEVFDAEWEPVLAEDTWQAVRAVLTARKWGGGEPGGNRARRYLLTGFLRCGRCTAQAHGTRSRAKPSYVCVHRDMRRLAEPIEAEVRDWVLERAVLVVERLGVDPALAAAVQGYDARLAEAREFWAEGVMTAAEYAATKRDLEARRVEAEAKLAASSDTEVWLDAEHLGRGEQYAENRLWWDQADLRQRRALIERYADSVVMHPLDGTNRGCRVEIVPKPT